MPTETDFSPGIRTALVTGGSRGIGRAACVALASQGAKVAVHYRSHSDAANQVASNIREAGGRAVALCADLLERGAGADLVNRVTEALGPHGDSRDNHGIGHGDWFGGGGVSG